MLEVPLEVAGDGGGRRTEVSESTGSADCGLGSRQPTAFFPGLVCGSSAQTQRHLFMPGAEWYETWYDQ